MNAEGLEELLQEQEVWTSPMPSKLPVLCPCGARVGYWTSIPKAILVLCKDCQHKQLYKFHLEERKRYISDLKGALKEAEDASEVGRFELEEGTIVVPRPNNLMCWHSLDRASERVHVSYEMLSKK